MVEAPRCGVNTTFGKLEERMVRRRRLRHKNVQGSSGHLAGAQGFCQGLFVDDAAAGTIHNADAALDQRQGTGADQVAGFIRQRRVDGQEVAMGQQLVQLRDTFDAELSGLIGCHERIEAEDLHVQTRRTPSHLAADASQADHAERLAGQLRADQFVPFPLPLPETGIRGRNVPCERHDQRNRVLGRADRIAARRVHDHDPAARGRGNVDVIDAHAGPDDGAKLTGVFEHVRGDPRSAANDDAVGSADRFLQSGARQAVPLVELDARLTKEFETGGFQFVADQDASWGA